MHRRGSASSIIVLIAVAFIVGGIWYYELHRVPSQSNQMMSSVPSQSAAPSVGLKIDGSDGPLFVPLGSYLQFAWTSNDVEICTSTGWSPWPPLTPFPRWGSSTQEWDGGGGTIYSKSDHYQITCMTSSGNNVSDTVEVNTLPVTLTIDPNQEISNPYQVPLSAKNTLFNSFEVRMGSVGTYLSDIHITLSQDVVSGRLPIDPTSLKALVFAPAPPDQAWFVDPSDYGPPYDKSGGPDAAWSPDLAGLIWLPANSTTTIEIYGDITNAPPGKTYRAPLGIALKGGSDLNSLFQLDRESGSPGYWSNRPIGDDPIPTPTSTIQPYVSGQDIQITR